MAGPSPSPDPRRAALSWRLAVWTLLILGWLVMLLYAWSAFSTLPSPERLEQSRLVPIPTLGTFLMLIGRSAAELAVLLAVLWPWRDRRWTLRLGACFVLLAAWFVLTTPLSLSAMDWVHRRWLAAMAAGLLLAFLVTAAGSLVRSGPPRESGA